MRLIDADALITRMSLLMTSLCERHDMEHDSEFNQGVIEAMNAVDSMNTIDPVKHGRWKVWYHGEYAYTYSCDQCGGHGDGTAYCPWCGANMEGGEE